MILVKIMTQKQYSFLQEISSSLSARNANSEVGDPIGGVDAETEATRRKAKALKSRAELIQSATLLKKTKYDAQKINQQIEADQQEQANIQADKERQQQQQAEQQAAAQQQAQAQADNINQYVNQQVGIPSQQPVTPQDPTMDPNAQ